MVILGNLIVPQLEKNNNPNSQVRHVLVPPTTMTNIPATFTNSNKTTRKNLSKQINLPVVGNLTKDEYQLRELRLRIITPVRDTWTNPDRKIFQWGTLVMEMHKLPEETQYGCRTLHLHPAHDVTNDNHRTNMYQHVKSIAEKIRALVKSNFNCKRTGFTYKRNDKDPADPVRLETVTATNPNHSRIIALLMVAVLINRTAFWLDPDSVTSLHKKLVGTYIVEQQRINMCHQLEVQLSLLPLPSIKTKAGPRWGKQGQSTQSGTPPGDPQTMRVFNAARQDQTNQVTPTNTLLNSPPEIGRSSSHINRSAAAILGSPSHHAGILFAASTKGTAPSPQGQQNSAHARGSKQDVSKPPTPKTSSASTSPKKHDQRRLFPNKSPQGDNRTQDLSECNKTNSGCGLKERSKPSDQETALLNG